MTNEQLVELIQMNIDTQSNMEALYLQNKGMITRICRPYAHIEPLEDLLNTSYFGIVEAVNHFDSTKGFKFTTYAQHWILQAIRRHLRSCGLVHIPPHMKSLLLKYKRFLSDYEADRAGDPPTDGAVCRALYIEDRLLADLKKFALCDRIASLDSPIESESGEISLLDYIESPDNMEESTIDRVYKESMREDVQEAMRIALTEQEQDTVRAYFWNGATLESIASEKGVSRERIRQQLQAAQRKLSRGQAGRILKEYAKIESGRYRGGWRFFKSHSTSVVEWEILRKDDILENARAKYEQMKQREQERMMERLNLKAI